MDGVHDSSVSAWPADAELFKFFDKRTFGVASWRPRENLASFNAVALQLVAGLDGWQYGVVLAAAIDAQETIEEDDLAFSFKE